MNISLNYLRHKNFAIYGLGVTGRSVIDYFNKYDFKNFVGWDDDNQKFKKFLGSKYKRMRGDFLKLINFVDYIIPVLIQIWSIRKQTLNAHNSNWSVDHSGIQFVLRIVIS